MKSKEIMEIIRSCVRPFIAITGWGLFCYAIFVVLQKFLDLDLAKILIISFTEAVSLIVGVYIGTRMTKK